MAIGTIMALASLAQAGVGAYQAYKGSQLGKTPRPEYEIPQALKDALSSAQRQASQIELPGQATLEQKLSATTSKGVTTAEKFAESPESVLAALPQMVEGERSGLRDIGVAAARSHDINQDVLRNWMGQMAGEEKQQWSWDKQQPYMDAMAASRRMSEAGGQNIWGGVSGGLNTMYQQDIDKQLLEIMSDAKGGTKSTSGGVGGGIDLAIIEKLKGALQYDSPYRTSKPYDPSSVLQLGQQGQFTPSSPYSDMFLNYDSYLIN